MSDKTISRRTVTAGVAWAVPAVVAASAVPAFAVSKGVVTLVQISDGCKQPGGSCDKAPWFVKGGYLITARLCSSVVAPITVLVKPAQVTFNGVATTMALDADLSSFPTGWIGVTQANGDLLITVPASSGTPICADLVLSLTRDSSPNASIQGSASFTWQTVAPAVYRTGTGSLAVSVNATEPCNPNCEPPPINV